MVAELAASRSACDVPERRVYHVNTGCRASVDPRGWLAIAVAL